MDTEKKKSIDEKVKDLTNRSTDFQDKFTYYILAVDAACIGFSINYNKTPQLSWCLFPFVIAIVFWLLSFHFGIQELKLTDQVYTQNQRFLVAQRMENENLKDQYLDDLNIKNDKFAVVAKYKIFFLYFGAIAFLVWYFLKISV